MRKIHEVKSWSHFYQAIVQGKKKHDLRKNDRDYNVGDIVVLQEYDNINGKYTGNEAKALISYMTDNRVPCAFSSAVLPKDYCILSLDVKPSTTNVYIDNMLKHDSYGYFPKWWNPGDKTRVRLLNSGFKWGSTVGMPFQDGDCNGSWHITVQWDNGSTSSESPSNLVWDSGR